MKLHPFLKEVLSQERADRTTYPRGSLNMTYFPSSIISQNLISIFRLTLQKNLTLDLFDPYGNTTLL